MVRGSEEWARLKEQTDGVMGRRKDVGYGQVFVGEGGEGGGEGRASGGDGEEGEEDVRGRRWTGLK